MKVNRELGDVLKKTYQRFDRGLLLASGKDDMVNVMTISWGLVGSLWREPVFMVAVRPSRHTHKLIEETKEFTVNVPTEELEESVALCGAVSGRDHDKFKEAKLTPMPGMTVRTPIVSECMIHYECKVVGKTSVLPESLSDEVLSSCYSSGDYHTLYYGKILASRGDGK